jgi:hypothetical protein
LRYQQILMAVLILFLPICAFKGPEKPSLSSSLNVKVFLKLKLHAYELFRKLGKIKKCGAEKTSFHLPSHCVTLYTELGVNFHTYLNLV